MKKDNQQLLIYAGGLAILYFGVLRPILNKFGITKSQADQQAQKEIEEQRKKQLDQQQSQLQQQGIKPTKTDQEWQVIADTIYEDLRYAFYADNKKDAVYQVARVKNDADFWLLYRKFKKRRDYVLGIPSGDLMDLPNYLKANLSKEDFDVINDNYRRKNIKFRF